MTQGHSATIYTVRATSEGVARTGGVGAYNLESRKWVAKVSSLVLMPVIRFITDTSMIAATTSSADSGMIMEN